MRASKRSSVKARSPEFWSTCAWMVGGSLLIVDILAFALPFVGKLGMVLWFLSLALIFRYALERTRESLSEAVKGQGRLIWLVVLWSFSFLLYGIGKWRFITGEALPTMACVMDHFSKSTDWGFHQTCHFGYPARGFALAALPSLVFGRGVVPLNAGAALYLVLGYLTVGSALYRAYGNKRQSDLVGAVILALLFHSYIFIACLISYEQRVFPMAWALVLCGVWSHFMRRRSEEDFAILALLSLQLAYSYTPALALLFGLAGLVAWEIYLGKAKRSQRRWQWFALTGALLGGVLSLLQRSDLRFSKGVYGTASPLVTRTTQTLVHALFENKYHSNMTLVLQALVLFYLLASLSGKLGQWQRGVGIWMLVTMVAGAAALGVTTNGPYYAVYRGAVFVPVFAWAFGLALAERARATKRWRVGLALSLALALGWGTINAVELIRQRADDSVAQLIPGLQRIIPKEEWSKPLALIIAPLPAPEFAMLDFSMHYFAPHLQIEKDPSHCRVSLEKFPVQYRIVKAGAPCQLPGAAERVGVLEFQKTEYPVERIR